MSRPETQTCIKYLPHLRDDHFGHAIALREHARLFMDGHTNVTHLTGDEEAFVAYRDNTLVGLLVFEPYEDDPTRAWVALAWTSPSWRGLGVFRELWFELVDCATNNGFSVIEVGVAITNNEANCAYQRMPGLIPCWTVYEYEIDSALPTDLDLRRKK